MKLDNTFLDRLTALDDKSTAVAKKLALLVRPAFIARPGKTLVWGDFANIEARVLPWLADSKGAEAKLDIFRAVDRDPTLPDVYMRTACSLTDDDPDEMWAAYRDPAHDYHSHAYGIRQSHGKVPELSLGFGGGLGALQAMAANYGVFLDSETATRVVADWRVANRWAVRFWGAHSDRDGVSYGIWGAANSAIQNHDTPYAAGRLIYVYDKVYMGGTLFCILPCGRPLTYPGIKWEWREVEDKKTKKLVDRYQLTYIKGYGRTAAWYGKFAENATQAGAASVLRRTMRTLEKDPTFRFMPIVMHTHDEIVTEPSEAKAKTAAAELKGAMETNEEWDQGLPLAAEITENWYYSKAVK